jgi:hypothetical protein
MCFCFDPRILLAYLLPGVRQRSDGVPLQVTLMSDATLRYTGFDDKVPTWEASGEIEVEPATACENDEGPETDPDPVADEATSPGEPGVEN